MKYSADEVAEAKTRLLAILKPGDTVYTVLNHVSRSGARREITLWAIHDNEPLYLSGNACKVLGLSRGKRDGCMVDGGGMDMGFHLVYELSARLFREYCNGAPKGKRPAHVPHTNNGPACTYGDGGYALKQRWM